MTRSANRHGRAASWLLGILILFATTAAQAANDQIIWENQAITNGGAVANGRVLTDQLGLVTATYGVAITGLPNATTTFNSGTTGNHAGYNRLEFDHDDDDPNDRMTITLTFSQPVSNLQFSLLDIDRDGGNAWVDAVEILYNGGSNARTDGFAVPTNGVAVANDNENYMEGFEGTASSAANTVDGNVGVNFGTTLVSSITIRYFGSDDAVNDPVAQFIGISDMSFVAARLTLRKTWVNAVLNNAVSITATRNATVIDTLASVANATSETDTDATPILVFTGNTISFAETFTAGTASNYATTLACSGAADTNPNDGLLIAAADANIVCTYTNSRLSSITIVKDAVPNDPQDFSFTTTGTGLANFQLDDDANATLSNTQTFSALAPGSYGITETPVAAWALTALACTGDTDNGSTINLAGGAVTIDLDNGENITCTFTNSRLPTLSLFKTSNGGTGTFNFTLTNADTDVSVGSVGNQSAAAITTTAPGTPVQFDASPVLAGVQNIRIATLNAPVVITEAQTAGFNLQAATSCTAGTSGATFTQALVNNGTTAGSMTITPPVGGFAPGSTLSCTFVNAPLQANLQVTKTNNATQVTSGTPTTYTIVVTNNGPDAVTGAQVSDTPGAGLACPATNTVTCAPAGNCPASPLTVGNLVSGITLPTLANGATATLSFACNVQ